MAKRKAKARSNGEGSIYRLADGRWRAVLTVGFVGDRQIRRSRTVNTQADARAAMDKLRSERAAGVGYEDLTVEGFLETWLASEIEPHRKPNTHATYHSVIKNHIIPYLGTKLVRDLKPLGIRSWLLLLKEAGTAGTRAQQIAYNTLQTALDYAVSMQYLSSNPVSPNKRPKHVAEDIDPFDSAEVKKLLKATRETDMHVACAICLTLGLREAELFGLRMIDIDLKANTLTVAQQAMERGKSRFEKVKTKASRRKISIPPTVRDAIVDHQKWKLANGLGGSELIFPAPDGQPWYRSNFIRRRWIPLLEKLQIRHRGFHHCRHTAATHMLASKPPIAITTIAHILGHANSSITMRIYAHYLPEHGADAVDSLQRLYG